MKTLRLSLLMILLAGSAAAQVQSSASGAPDVTVLKISWHWVAPSNPQLYETRIGGGPEAAKMAVNQARINENISARDQGGSPPAPVLIPVSSAPESLPVVRPWSGWEYKFTVKNTGTKTIRQVAFEHTFTDPGTQQTLRRRQYKSKVRIRPGMTATIVMHSALPPTGTINATPTGQNSADQSQEQMVINRIKYADGSVWERSSNPQAVP